MHHKARVYLGPPYFHLKVQCCKISFLVKPQTSNKIKSNILHDKKCRSFPRFVGKTSSTPAGSNSSVLRDFIRKEKSFPGKTRMFSLLFGRTYSNEWSGPGLYIQSKPGFALISHISGYCSTLRTALSFLTNTGGPV